MVKAARCLCSSADACKTATCTTTIVGTVVSAINDAETAISAYVGTATTGVAQVPANIVTVSFKLL